MKKINLKAKPFKPLDALLCVDNLSFAIHECMLCRDRDDNEKFDEYFDMYMNTLSDLINISVEVDSIETIKKSDKEYS